MSTIHQQDNARAPACIAVVIPCYQVGESIFDVLDHIGPEVEQIFCVDDCSTDDTVEIIEQVSCYDTRVQLIRRKANGGVGAAVLDGYQAAIEAGADIIVKVDGDGQMDPTLIPRFCEPILDGTADYVKGNRFFFLDSVRSMPGLRIVGNAGLSFLTKLSTGYWEIVDPTNGYTAIHAKVAQTLPVDRISKRYFFESDLLFRLGVIRARVVDLPLSCVYGDETSHLNIWHCLATFPGLHLKNLVKRIAYNYFVRNFSIASVNLVLGLILCGFGLGFGINHWIQSAHGGRVATAGTVMLAALPVILGFQLLLNFLSFDMSMLPREPLQRRLSQIQLLKPRTAETIGGHNNPLAEEQPCLRK